MSVAHEVLEKSKTHTKIQHGHEHIKDEDSIRKLQKK
jgi:hypothetical protein